MQIDKQQVLQLLENAGRADQVGRAEAELPDPVDTEQHASLLEQLGLRPDALLGGAGGSEVGHLGL